VRFFQETNRRDSLVRTADEATQMIEPSGQSSRILGVGRLPNRRVDCVSINQAFLKGQRELGHLAAIVAFLLVLMAQTT